MRCTVLNLANNHVLDCGEDGLLETIVQAENRKIFWHGVGRSTEEASRPIVLEQDGLRIALLALTDDCGQCPSRDSWGTASGLSIHRVRRMIEDGRAEADYVIVQYHGGGEFIPLPSRQEIGRLRRMAEWGADVVICHHAHVVRPWESFQNAFVFYGLGNFVFDIPGHQARSGTPESALVMLSFSREGLNFDVLRTRLKRDLGQIERDAESPHIKPLGLEGYRAQYCKAVYDTHYWPDIPRDRFGAPDNVALNAKRSPLLKRIRRVSRLQALRSRRVRRQAFALLEYRVRIWLRRQWARIAGGM